MNTASRKRLLRRELGQRRDDLADRQDRSAAICARVAALPVYQAARALHCYLPIRSEADTRPLIALALGQGKRVAAPIVRPDQPDLLHTWLPSLAAADFEPGAFGTLHPRLLQPAAPGDWDLIIVPLLGFDRAGYRLGYGKGYYDRLLAAAPVPALGVAFGVQEVAALPRERHDIPLDWIVTEDEVIAVARAE